MSLLENTTQATNLEKATDRLGGYQLLDSDVHLMEIELAYLHVATSKAKAVVFHFKSDAGTLRSTQYFTSGTAKGCKTFYEKDGKQFPLPGFTLVEDIFKATVGTGLDSAVLVDKVIKLYNKEAQGEVNTPIKAIENLMGQKVALGVVKQIVDKTSLGSDNAYHPTGETREQNDIDKVFTSEGLTIPEKEAGVTEPSFINDWKAKYQGEVINLAKGASGTAGAPAQNKPAKKLFT